MEVVEDHVYYENSSKRSRSRSHSPSSKSSARTNSVPPPLLPVIITFPESNKCFKELTLGERKHIIAKVEATFPRAKTRVGSGGDLFIDPSDTATRILILQTKRIDDFDVVCSRTLRESEPKGLSLECPWAMGRPT